MIQPVERTVTVPVAPERAFEAFTDEVHEWWPIATHSVGGAGGSVAFVDGSIVETLPDGSTTTWGDVTTWDPPKRVAFTWHPGTPPGERTHVEITFAEVEGGTEVTLVHDGWEARPDGTSMRDAYETGWGVVLGAFAGHM